MLDTSFRRLWTLLVLLFSVVASAQHMGLVVRDSRSPPGAEVTAVAPGTPAAKVELQPGDVIVAVQGKRVANADQFGDAAHAVAPGSIVALRVSRQGWEKELRLQSPAPRLSFGFGVEAGSAGGGIAIASVDPGGPAAAAGLAAGDRVSRLDGRAVVDVGRLRARIDEAADKGAALVLAIERGGWSKEVTLLPRPVEFTPPPHADGGAPVAAAPRSAVPSTIAAEMDEANRQYDAGNWRAAESAYRELLQIAGDDPRIWGRLCHVLIMEERFADSIDVCKSAGTLAPAEAGIFQNIGYAQSRLGDYGSAIAAYKKAIERAPAWAAPYAGVAAAYFNQRDWAKAEEFYRLAVERDAKNPMAWQAIGDAAGEQGKSSDAIAAYRKALELGPPGPELLRSLGWQLYRERRYAEAESALLEARRLNGSDVAVLLALASVEKDLGKLADARTAWQRAAELDPSGLNGAIARQNLVASAAVEPAASADARSPTAAHAAAAQLQAPAPVEYGRTGALAPARVPDARPAPPPPGVPLKTAIAIGDFQVKAANAGQYVGDGLREMLVTALHGSGRFVVVERMDIKGLAAEQALSRSRMARQGEAIPESQMDVADVMIYGAVTEFESEAKGGGLSIGMPNVPITLGLQGKSAHMAVDVRLVDVASGRVLATGRIVGEARSTQATVGANISARGVTMPATLGGFQNTPMEQAIRECIEKATSYVVANTPPSYFHHS